jgi:valyl-tRNA synthetase
MEPAMQSLVAKLFVQMYHDGLIYRGHRIVNWDPNLQTTVSDDEVEAEEQQANFYTFQYGPFQIGTSRPETKFGDKYVVVHPDDERYKDYQHGQEVELEWINGPITTTVIKDEAIDPEFGTGAMTITPWHDRTDFEIAERHKLDMEPIIDKEGRLLEIAGRFEGQTIDEARQGVVALLDEKGLLVDTDSGYRNSVGKAERGGGTIEPQVMEQWFIDVNKQVVEWQDQTMSLKQIMQAVVRQGDITIIPEKFEAVYFNWIDNLRDWCISRQIWWGHRIPAWYRDNELFVGQQPPPDDGQGEWRQDPDTLDTWFSSGTWTWSTLIEPELALDDTLNLKDILKKSTDFKHFHPTSLLETGYDIIFFWVARMILMTTYATGEIPFKDVYLHGMVRDRNGQKMSKSNPETSIDPLEMIEKYGADALRLSMLVGLSPGNDIKLYEEKIAGYRNFCNKLWNVGRFILDNTDAAHSTAKPKPEAPADAWITSKIDNTVQTITSKLENYQISQAGEDMYHLLWDDFADWYIESSKSELNQAVLVDSFRTILKLAHPLAPYVTEALWQHFTPDGEMLITAEWPTPHKHQPDQDKIDQFNRLQTVVSEIRELSNEIDLSETTLYHQPDDFLDEYATLIKQLTTVADVKQVADGRGLELASLDFNAWLDISADVGQTHLVRLLKRRAELANMVKQFESKLNNDAYINNAPKEIVNETREQHMAINEQLKKLNQQIENLERLIG